MKNDLNIGLAFSGGGYRAATFDLGTLSFLNTIRLEDGRTLLDAPDIDNVVHVKYRGRLKPGDVIAVRIEQAEEYELDAVMIRKEGK